VSAVEVSGALFVSANANAGTTCEQLRSMIGNFVGFIEAVDAAYATTDVYGFSAAGIEVGMWATLVDTSGTVCNVYTVDDNGLNNGADAGNDAWLGSRVISAQKANTANAFSLDTISIPTGFISAAVYPGGSLYGLQHSNPVDATIAYAGDAEKYGKWDDPLRGQRVGGVNVFGGGIALYDETGTKVGAVGVSGDTSCRDASMAYALRAELGLDYTPTPDVLTLSANVDAVGEQPLCGVVDPDDAAVGVVIGDIVP
jgi:uncharacterized protein GlcG (DUF336 family)